MESRLQKSIQSIIFRQFFLVVLGVFVVLSVSSYWFLKEVVFDIIFTDHSRILDSLVKNIDGNYAGQFNQISRLATFDGISPYKKTQAQKEVRNFLELGNIFSTLHLYDKDGHLLLAEKRSDFPKYHAAKSYKKNGQSPFETLVER